MCLHLWETWHNRACCFWATLTVHPYNIISQSFKFRARLIIGNRLNRTDFLSNLCLCPNFFFLDYKYFLMRLIKAWKVVWRSPLLNDLTNFVLLDISNHGISNRLDYLIALWFNLTFFLVNFEDIITRGVISSRTIWWPPILTYLVAFVHRNIASDRVKRFPFFTCFNTHELWDIGSYRVHIFLRVFFFYIFILQLIIWPHKRRPFIFVLNCINLFVCILAFNVINR